jgi:hypothetical protein
MCTPVISVLRRLRQDDCEFKTRLGHKTRLSSQKKKREKKTKILPYYVLL